MLKKKKLLIVVAVVLLAVGAGYKMVLAPKPKPVKEKVVGTLASVGDPFTLNLADGHYGRVTVALLLSAPPPAPAAGASNAPAIPQQDVVRAVITDDLTGASSGDLVDRSARHAVIQRILRDLKQRTDEPVTAVLFTDLAVQ